MQDEDELKDENALHSSEMCYICYEDFKEGDEIACSRNNECHHEFHLKCIKMWLMKHDECPICRGNYLSNQNSDDDRNSNTADAL